MFDDEITKWVFWLSILVAVIALTSFGVLLSIVYGALIHG